MSNLPYQIKIFLFIVAAFVNLLAPEIGASKKNGFNVFDDFYLNC